MFKNLILTLTTAFLLLACSNDDSPMPPYQFALVDLPTNSNGIATQVVFDNKETVQLTHPISQLKADTTYRLQATFVMQNEGKVQLYNYQPILAPEVKEYPIGTRLKHPLDVVTLWQTPRYINLQLSIKGTANGVHYFGFAPIEHRTNADGSRTLAVELIHNQNNDPLYYTRTTYLSLPLLPLNTQLRAGIDSVQLTINTFSGHKVYKFKY